MSYLKAFQKVDTKLPDLFILPGDCLFVEEVKPEEQKTAGGILIPTSGKILNIDGIEATRPMFVRVLKVGAGYYDKDGYHVSLDSQPGDILLVGKLSVKWLSCFGPIVSAGDNPIGMVRESDHQGHFPGIGSQEKYFDALKEALVEG